MCYPLIVQRLNNQVSCEAYSFVCNDELLFFESTTTPWGKKDYFQECSMADLIKLDTIHGICYFYSLIHSVANKVKYPWAYDAFRKGPIYSKCRELILEKQRKLKENPHLIPKIEKQRKFVVTYCRRID